ncbi:hypothetical protein C0992_007881 [Termitomyces sp. T32_za158]|nr:hypothetical protein C0992_007881 [Termitomyces sp. T32_za158]
MVYEFTCWDFPGTLYELEQLFKYCANCMPGMENTWQGIMVNFAYRMHWRTLFGFALCRALCANSAEKTTLVQWLALVVAHPGLYHKAIDAFNKVYKKPFKAQMGAQLTIHQVHVPDDKVENLSNNDTLSVLLYNHVPVECVDHTYTYSMVYLEERFHQLTMSLDIFHEINNERFECLKIYGTPAAVPDWDKWCKINKED